ncbi:ABC transporter ATP-binding protein [Pseudomonas sp. dw_358]|uniref:ABC transporter ATP-binding protein n=1 Tax=Pseudomonas sp. dw_358 TaxID=2720083 RepID=UPI001BD2F53E|nr:ABC transporter ATP-binding protein [Pseudomonas sp. dw_358]
MLLIEGLHKHYVTPQGPLQILQGIDLTLASGASLALMGESGSGKSTLLHLVAGLDRFDSGTLQVAGLALEGLAEHQLADWRRREVGLIFQQFHLVGSLTVADNLAFQARLAQRYDQVWQDQLIERLGLADLLGRYPEQLSGGQQQRVALGRALAGKPRLLLADEPTGNLDESTSANVLQLLLELQRDSASTLLMVTHSPLVASQLQRTVVLRAGRVHPAATP